MKEKVIGFIKKDTVLCVAMTLAMVSAFFVKPTLNYVNYIDFRVLGILLSLMTVMAGLQRNGLFDMIGSSLLKRTKNTMQLSLVLVFLSREDQAHPHNVLLTFLSETGILGTLGYLLLFIYLYYYTIKNYIVKKDVFSLAFLIEMTCH